jgi:hypothetical protein
LGKPGDDLFQSRALLSQRLCALRIFPYIGLFKLALDFG